jgi:hypothetical protein
MQPDFSALFRREKVAPLHFRVRDGASAVHDVQFLSSYLHDARLTPAALKQRGKRVALSLERDCWELGFTQHARSSELHIARCRLTVSPVSAIRWESAAVVPADRELWIESIYLGPTRWETPDACDLVLSAPHARWKLVISIADHAGDIRLDDLETPYLHFARKA